MFFFFSTKNYGVLRLSNVSNTSRLYLFTFGSFFSQSIFLIPEEGQAEIWEDGLFFRSGPAGVDMAWNGMDGRMDG